MSSKNKLTINYLNKFAQIKMKILRQNNRQASSIAAVSVDDAKADDNEASSSIVVCHCR